jgi:hypothetical protein
MARAPLSFREFAPRFLEMSRREIQDFPSGRFWSTLRRCRHPGQYGFNGKAKRQQVTIGKGGTVEFKANRQSF